MSSPSQPLTPLVAMQRMSLDEYRDARVALGEQVEAIGGVYWARARLGFCRPLLRWVPVAPNATSAPRIGRSGYQHVVAEGSPANSTMGFVMLENSPDYSLQTASHNRRRLIKAAAKCFTVAPITDLSQLCQGHAAYVSFYDRTKYEYRSERTRKAEFAQWARATFAAPKALILGGYGDSRLLAVSVSYWVQDTIIYTTFFSDTPALQKGIGELLFHALRESASRTSGVHQIFVRPYQGGNGMDQYYLMRGAKVVQKPASLHLHPLAKAIMRVFAPERYRLLKGNPSLAENNGLPSSQAAGPVNLSCSQTSVQPLSIKH